MTGPGLRMTRQEAADLLAVAPAAAPAEVQHAFLRAARRVHPDVLPEAGDEERRAAAAAFDRLLRARDLLLTPLPAPPGSAGPSTSARLPGRGLGGSLVVLALMAFLLVLLVTVQQGFRGGPGDPAPPAAPGTSVAP